MAVMVPSFLAPTLIHMLAEDVGPVARNTSSRLMTSLTGRPALRDRASARGSMKIVVLPPKPPPISDAVTRRREISRPRIAAQLLRTMKWPCVQHHSSPVPSELRLPTHAWGSIYPWCVASVRNLRSTMVSAAANPSSTSPWPNWTRPEMLDGVVGVSSNPSVKILSCSSGASSLQASSTSVTWGRTS